MIDEKTLEKRFVKKIKEKGGIAYKFSSPGCVGVPDRLVLMPGGRICFAELKTMTGRLSVSQERQIKKIRSFGHRVYIVRPDNMDEVLNEICSA